MRAKAQLSRSDLPINIEKKARNTSRVGFSPVDVAHGMTPEVKDFWKI